MRILEELSVISSLAVADSSGFGYAYHSFTVSNLSQKGANLNMILHSTAGI